jgi:uncharacterized membrane protein
LATTLLGATTAFFQKSILEKVSIMTVATIMVSIMALVLLVLTTMYYKTIARDFVKNRTGIVPLLSKIVAVSVIGILSFFAYNYAVQSVDRTHLYIIVSIMSTSAIFVALISYLFYGGKISAIGWTGLAIAFLGQIMVVYGTRSKVPIVPPAIQEL